MVWGPGNTEINHIMDETADTAPVTYTEKTISDKRDH